MAFGFDKCAIINIRRGQVENQQRKYKYVYKDNEEVQPEQTQISRDTTKPASWSQQSQDLHRKAQGSHKKFWTPKKQIITLSTWAISVLTYSFGIIEWIDTDFEGLDRLIRRLLCKIPLPPPTFVYNKIISTAERRMRLRKYPQITQNTSKEYEEEGEINWRTPKEAGCTGT